ncbi:inhibin beta C chain [Bombina bombina]|uniref:inhibin beta C chain n=1 Tax=Bombina bombina TaxID=8345 RepID=UPI00235A8E8E|nr:inhibin beta C chain [Bombina bombina]
MSGYLSLYLLFAIQASLGEASCSACRTFGQPLEDNTKKDILLEVAKQNILSKLHLKHRPNISNTISREALAQALLQLNDRVEYKGSVPEQGDDNEVIDSEKDYEIISFAEIGNSKASHSILHFHLSAEKDRHRQIHSVDVWLYLQAASGKKVTVTGTSFLSKNPSSKGSVQVDVLRSAWYTVPLPIFTRKALGDGEENIYLELQCFDCLDQSIIANISEAQHPFLVVKARNQKEGPRIRRKSTECSSDSDMCCRKDFYIDFKEIGWSDWIISPDGYHMNLCEGRCPIHLARVPGIAASSHTAIFSLIKANNLYASLTSCCVPTKRRPLSVLYFDMYNTIVKTDIPDMIVESCGCT